MKFSDNEDLERIEKKFAIVHAYSKLIRGLAMGTFVSCVALVILFVGLSVLLRASVVLLPAVPPAVGVVASLIGLAFNRHLDNKTKAHRHYHQETLALRVHKSTVETDTYH